MQANPIQCKICKGKGHGEAQCTSKGGGKHTPKGGKGTGYGGTGGNGPNYGGKGGGKFGKGKGNGKGKGGKILGFGEEYDGTWGAAAQSQWPDLWGASTNPQWPPGLGASAPPSQPWINAATTQQPSPTPWMPQGSSNDAWGSWGPPTYTGQPAQGNGGFASVAPRQMSSLTIKVVKPIETRNSFQALAEREILNSEGQKSKIEKSLGDVMIFKARKPKGG